VTIFGTGGVGKTRLALAVAERVNDRNPDGVVYVDLSAVSEPPLVISSIAEALGMRERTGAALGARLNADRDAKRLLIVLDNVEQVVAAAPDLADLLAEAPDVELLVTSRLVLNLRGERLYEVEPLSVPAGEEETTAAVELFLDRATAARPDFRPTGDDLAAIAELTRELDGLPLAIELASAWIRVMSPRAILERMGERPLELLRTGSRDMPKRHRRRYEAYYLELAEQGSIPQGDVDATDWLERLDNFQAVLERAVRRGDAAEGVRMGRALAGFWHLRGWYSEGQDWMKDATAWYTLELWAMAELGEGRAERALRLFALAERGYRGSHPRRNETETHRRLEAELRAAIGARYEPLMAEARQRDFDAAMEELASEASAG
jgi:predicted ATPase